MGGWSRRMVCFLVVKGESEGRVMVRLIAYYDDPHTREGSKQAISQPWGHGVRPPVSGRLEAPGLTTKLITSVKNVGNPVTLI